MIRQIETFRVTALHRQQAFTCRGSFVAYHRNRVYTYTPHCDLARASPRLLVRCPSNGRHMYSTTRTRREFGARWLSPIHSHLIAHNVGTVQSSRTSSSAVLTRFSETAGNVCHVTEKVTGFKAVLPIPYSSSDEIPRIFRKSSALSVYTLIFSFIDYRQAPCISYEINHFLSLGA